MLLGVALGGALAAMSRRTLPATDLPAFPTTYAPPWQTGTCLARLQDDRPSSARQRWWSVGVVRPAWPFGGRF